MCYVAKVLLLSLFVFICYGSQPVKADDSLYVNVQYLNVRSRPLATSEVVGWLLKGTLVISKTKEGVWVKIAAPKSVEGWVHGAYLSSKRPILLQQIFEERQKEWNEKYEEAKNDIIKSRLFDELNRWSYDFAQKNSVENWRGEISFFTSGNKAIVDVQSQQFGIQVNYKGEVESSQNAYKQLSEIKNQSSVFFFGSFQTKNNVIEEESWTKSGRMYNPAFRFNFTSFSADPTRKVQQEQKQAQESEIPQKQREPWYSGGNLHKATLGDWKKATYANKLATCADFVAAAAKYAHRDISMEEMRKDAEALVVCIDETALAKGADHLAISEIATLCLVLMGKGR